MRQSNYWRCEVCGSEPRWSCWGADDEKRTNRALPDVRLTAFIVIAREDGWYIEKGRVLCPDCWKEEMGDA